MFHKLIGVAASAYHEAAQKFPGTLKVCFMSEYCFSNTFELSKGFI